MLARYAQGLAGLAVASALGTERERIHFDRWRHVMSGIGSAVEQQPGG